MSISIYYIARRLASLTDDERARIANVEKKYTVEDQVDEYARTGVGYNWESFCVYKEAPTEPDVIFKGTTKLPNNSEDAMWAGVQHWCSALTDIRRILHDADWDVRVEDHEIQWDADAGKYDPTR